MHYLVTGGCGFIGSHLIELLLQDGHKISVIDNLSTGKRENIPTGVQLIVADITTPGIFNDLISDIDGCFHLAAIVSVQQSAEEWLRTHQVNQSGTVALFDTIARKKKPIPVVYASSAATYGDCPDIPLRETATTTPLSAYGVDKLVCEWQARIASTIHSIPAIGLRFFNVYGERQDPTSPYSGVISIFASRIKKNQPITIFGDGGQTRDFIYVGDIAYGLTLSMHALEQGKMKYGVYNLCTGIQTSIRDLAKIMKELASSNSTMSYAPARAGDIRYSAGSTELSRKELGFTAMMLLRNGLKQTLKAI